MIPITAPSVFSSRVNHGFFTRKGGVSTGLFDSLNTALYSQDESENICENRNRIAAHLGGGALVSLKQIHSAQCWNAQDVLQDVKGKEGDALVTDQPDIIISVLTADCAPVLFEGQKPDGGAVIGAAHAGWGGALKGVCDATVEAMVEIGAQKETIKAAIGPCIGADSYEVGKDFSKPFLSEDENSSRFFQEKNNGIYFDLPSYVAFRLSRCGVEHIVAINRDTYTDEEYFFSFRRATHRKENDYGRQLSVISILKT